MPTEAPEAPDAPHASGGPGRAWGVDLRSWELICSWKSLSDQSPKSFRPCFVDLQTKLTVSNFYMCPFSPMDFS